MEKQLHEVGSDSANAFMSVHIRWSAGFYWITSVSYRGVKPTSDLQMRRAVGAETVERLD